MNGVDEVAVKRVRAEAPSARDLSLFHKEVQVRLLSVSAVPAALVLNDKCTSSAAWTIVSA